MSRPRWVGWSLAVALVLADAAAASPRRVLQRSAHGIAASLPANGRLAAAHPVGPILVIFDHRDARAAETLAAALRRRRQRWLDAHEVADRFGVPRAHMARARRWFEAQGVSVLAESAHRRSLTLAGPAGAVERAFGTELVWTSVAGRALRVARGDPTLPAALGIGGVLGLEDLPRLQPLLRAQVALPPDAPALDPRDFATVYETGALLAAGERGAGRSIAVLARSNFADADIAAFADRFTTWRPAPPERVFARPGSDPGIADAIDELEALLDAQWAGGVAPEATVRVVIGSRAGGIPEALVAAVEQRLGDVISISFGLCEPLAGTLVTEFFHELYVRAALQGQSVVVASGDAGATDCELDHDGLAVNALAASPFAVAVGGTAIDPLFDAGGRATGYGGAQAWNDEFGAGGGGVSAVFGRPAFQLGLAYPAGRAIPDLALMASPAAPGQVAVQGGQTLVVGGTSVGAPAMAGLLALAGARRGEALGHVLPGLYRLAAAEQADSSPLGAFHDVTDGDNGFPAGPGFDLATGWGSPRGLGLVHGLAVADPAPCEPPWACAVTGPTLRRGCLVEWLLPDVSLEAAAGGRPSRKQRCRDGAACDRDGGIDAACTIDVALCVNVIDPRLATKGGQRACQARALDRLRARVPRSTADPVASGNRQRLEAALAALPPSPITVRDACTPAVGLRVPIPFGTTVGRLPLRVRARSGRRSVASALTLLCERAP